MIAVRLQGGLANQCFQYAAARAQALKRNEELLLDLSWFKAKPEEGPTARPFELNSLNIRAKEISPEELKLFQIEGVADRIRNKLGWREYEVFNENTPNYMPGIENLPEKVLLNGYFQSEKYFLNIREELLKEFSPAFTFSDEGKRMLEEVSKPGSVAIHVRRGDYLRPQALAFHGLCDVTYYTTAVNLLDKTFSGLRFFIFSDDPAWCRKELEMTGAHVFEGGQGRRSAEDMLIMAACEHQIIANSSYSWWSAWLNKNKNKKVVAPARWFADKSMKTDDLLPSDWIRV